jgi:hypothetical protein
MEPNRRQFTIAFAAASAAAASFVSTTTAIAAECPKHHRTESAIISIADFFYFTTGANGIRKRQQ